MQVKGGEKISPFFLFAKKNHKISRICYISKEKLEKIRQKHFTKIKKS